MAQLPHSIFLDKLGIYHKLQKRKSSNFPKGKY